MSSGWVHSPFSAKPIRWHESWKQKLLQLGASGVNHFRRNISLNGYILHHWMRLDIVRRFSARLRVQVVE